MLINNIELLLEKISTLKEQGKKIVLCHGHFNVIHPGHLRFLSFAKKHGDCLIVSVLNDEEIPINFRKDFFSQEERALGVASLSMVDYVLPLESSVVDLIKNLKPDYYVKGREFEKKQESIADEVNAVTSVKGKILFSSGEVEYASLKIFKEEESSLTFKKQRKFLEVCKKHNISLDNLRETVASFSKLNILVIGDTIVDQFVACDTLGVSSEAPVLAIRELESKEFVGGAAIIAQHLKSLGANGHYLSVIGRDNPGRMVKDTLDVSGVRSHLYIDDERPTTFKIRYMVENQKILRVSRLKQEEISTVLESKIIAELKNLIPNMDGVIVSDFVYGVITDNILNTVLELALKHEVKIFGDLQCSSQVGDVSKFKGMDLVTPTEKEIRIAMGDYSAGLESVAHKFIEKTKNKNLAVTLGANGVLVYDNSSLNTIQYSEYFPALEDNPLDVAGAGDTLLAGCALSLCANRNVFEAAALGSCLAAIAVKRIGNIPIKEEEVHRFIEALQSEESSRFLV